MIYRGFKKYGRIVVIDALDVTILLTSVLIPVVFMP